MHKESLVIFLGGIANEIDRDIIVANSKILPQFAAEAFQSNFIQIVKDYSFSKFYLVSLPFIGVYGLHTKIFFLIRIVLLWIILKIHHLYLFHYCLV